MRSTHRTRPSRPARTDGVPFATYAYDAYGADRGVETTATALVDAPTAAAIAAANALRYAGYCYDAYAGLYYLSQRYYDPATASFTTKDPARADGEQSPYQYCGGDPVNQVDPTGEWAKKVVDYSKRRITVNPVDITEYYLRVMATDAALCAAINSLGTIVGPKPRLDGASLAYIRSAAGRYGQVVVNKLAWFTFMVGPGRSWDFKPRLRAGEMYLLRTPGNSRSTIRYDEVSNIHFGVVGRALGLSLPLLHVGAGIAQKLSRTSNPAWTSTLYDDPTDYWAIERGYYLYPKLKNRKVERLSWYTAL